MSELTAPEAVRAVAAEAGSRLELWAEFLERVEARNVAEIGVYRGEFAAHVLARCGSIQTYYMIDPWRHLQDWNKPANQADPVFREIFDEAMRRTRDYERRRVVLRGRTTEVIDEIADGSLDFAYIDGDHTLRGITVDLVRAWPKIRDEGWIGGDDFVPSIWQHSAKFEPTLVFPFAVHFAEAVGTRIYGLPHGQFLIEKRTDEGFRFVDLTGDYKSVDLLSHLKRPPAPKSLAPAARVRRLARRVVRRVAH